MELKIGDKVRLREWEDDMYAEVLFCGKKSFLYRDRFGYEGALSIDKEYFRYIEEELSDDLVKDAQPKPDYSTHFEIVELKKSIDNINKRLGYLENTLGKVKRESTSLSNDLRQAQDNLKKRVIMLEQLQPKQTHPDANDNQPTVKNCDNCKYRYRDIFKRPCAQCSGIVTNYANWEKK